MLERPINKSNPGRLLKKRRWQKLGLVLCVPVLVLSMFVFTVPAEAISGERAAILMPFDNGGRTWINGEGPGQHHPSTSNGWATDLHSTPGTAVKPRVQTSDGAITMSVAAISNTCAAPNSAGQSVWVNMHVDGVYAGRVVYGHLDNLQVTVGNTINSSTVLGYIKLWNQSGCWMDSLADGLVHTHVEVAKGCYRSLSHETTYGGSTPFGLLSSDYATSNVSVCDENDVNQVMSPRSIDRVNFTHGDNFDDIAWYELYQGYPGTLAAINSNGSNQYIGWKEIGIGPADWKATGDFNGDGKTDIAWHEGSTLTIFTSSGQSFGIAWRLPSIGAPTWADVGDFNNDGRDDIAWYEQNSGSLAAFITNSTGTWMDIAYRATGIGPADWAGVGDFNGDGKDDVAWHEGSTLTNIVSTGHSWGVLWTNQSIGSPTWAQVGEFTGDNKDDIAWYEAASSTITNLASSGSSFDIRSRMHSIGAPTWAYVGDFNNDNKDDIVWYEKYVGYPGSLAAFLSNGSGFGVSYRAIGIGKPTWAGVGDFNGDGKDDVAWHEGSTLTNIASTGQSWGILWRVQGIGKPVWASNGSFPYK